jgi:hypothetical protein
METRYASFFCAPQRPRPSRGLYRESGQFEAAPRCYGLKVVPSEFPRHDIDLAHYETLTIVVDISGEDVMDTASVREHKLERCLRFLPKWTEDYTHYVPSLRQTMSLFQHKITQSRAGQGHISSHQRQLSSETRVPTDLSSDDTSLQAHSGKLYVRDPTETHLLLPFFY